MTLILMTLLIMVTISVDKEGLICINLSRRYSGDQQDGDLSKVS